MPLDTRIALGVQPLQVPDPLAQYGQVQNILAAQSQRQAAGTQNELAQLHVGQARMTMRQVQEAHDFVNKTMNAAAENGAPTKDPMDIAMQMSTHPTNATVQAMGEHLRKNLEILRAYQQDKAFATRGQQQPPQPLTATQLPPAVGGTPVFDRSLENFKAWQADKTTNLEFTDWINQKNAAQTPNQMLPAAAAVAPVESVNKLATPISKVDQIDAEIADLMSPKYMYSPQAKARIEFLNKRRDQLTKAHVVGPNLVTEEGKEIYTGKEKDSEFEQLLSKSKLSDNEKTALRVARARKEASHAPPISVSYGQEKAEAIDYGKLLVKGYETVQAAANLAQKSLPAIESNLAILDKGFDTGFATETKAAGAKVLAALGVKEADKYATDAQTFLANASAAVLQRQLEQKGPQTESDAQRISATGAQLGNTKDANRFVLNVAKAQLQRDIAQRNFYADWRKEHKTFDGADDAWNSGPGSKSLFDNPILKKYAAPTNATVAPIKDTRPPLTEIFKNN